MALHTCAVGGRGEKVTMTMNVDCHPHGTTCASFSFFFFFQCDIRLFEVAAIYMIIHSVPGDSLLFSPTFICFSSMRQFHRRSVLVI